MNETINKKLLIISNNVLSLTRNNGKTIFSYIDKIPRENVSQLYFNSEQPTIKGYDYFQITDRDILKGFFCSKKRGKRREAIEENKQTTIKPEKTIFKSKFFRFIRELLWKNKWKSKALIDWLDEVNPEVIFFVGGDSGFAYDICNYIQKRYNAKLSLYITDDYILPREKETLLDKSRRKSIKKKITRTLHSAENFFTVSEFMRKEYKEIFGRDSMPIVNLSTSMKMDGVSSTCDNIVLSYMGSLYYGRDEILGEIARTIESLNKTENPKAILQVYTNSTPSLEVRKKFEINGVSKYCGSLQFEELKLKLNQTDILVFVESFDKNQIEKTKYSLSTKIPEYMSVEKPIFAVGPAEIGSMDYLKGKAEIVNDIKDIEAKLKYLLRNEDRRVEIAKTARDFYIEKHNKEKLQKEFLSKLF